MKKSIKFMDKTVKTKTVIVVVAAFVALVVFVLAIGVLKGSSGNSSDAVVASGKKVTAEQLVAAPADHKGDSITFVGKVFSVEGSDDAYALQVYSDIENSDGNIIVYTAGSTKYNEGDYIEASGVVDEVNKGENAFGASLTVPTVIADSVKIVDADQAIAPSLTTKTPKLVKTIGGLNITLEKVEYAKDETRIFIHFDNSGADDYTFYDFDAKLVQDRAEIKEVSDYNRTIDNSSSDILSGTAKDVKLYYGKINPENKATLTFEVTDSTNYDATEVVFEI